ncbi:hypothetical protein EJ08DRAFT_659475 [Tothia fuscella]|uniref:Zn(2)-C6 fungal-type domain-containing protein n=1 Tax=Tothia fuscella TaxID=1048955 RepID=A0A9P4NUX8_9PEZI|nr:hypothetical protein EJ08DRAFT_659475 [Tothia fuscella]
MTRPKVAPEARRRTEQACESCKRRKQKCNGLTPCVTCAKRKFKCVYDERREPDSPSTTLRPAKRRMTESNLEGFISPKQDISEAPGDSSATTGHRRLSSFPPLPHVQPNFNCLPQSLIGEPGHDQRREQLQAAQSLHNFSTYRQDDQSVKVPSLTNLNYNTQSSNDEEAPLYSETRMLQDPTGRLLYVGDAATLSFLQLIRMMVESVCGQSAFTTDPRRHKIMESQFSLPANSRNTHLIPDKATASALVESYFVNTHAMVQLFDRNAFVRQLDDTYSDPLSAEPNWLCHLNLVFAIGLTMNVSGPGTRDAMIMDKLRRDHPDRAEVFYLNAKSLNDPMVGLEDADFWSVQALLLMTVYMLAKSKRNTAFALLGMAIRSSYALGLHREETLVIFGPDDQKARRAVWKSLFVMDRFLSCSLGRPPGIREEDCSGNMLGSSESTSSADDFGVNASFHGGVSFAQTSEQGLAAAVRSCSVIGTILKRVYQERKISTGLAQEIADICKVWPKALASPLHWQQASTASPSQGVAILHVNLLYCHSITLLTRPFFLFILNDVLQQSQSQPATSKTSRRNYSKMEKFSEACVIASTHTVVLVQAAFEAGHLPRRNPFVIYFLFAATLIMLSNEFALLYRNDAGDQGIQSSITIMSYCAETDPQASRLLYILGTFRDVVIQQRAKRFTQQQQQQQQQQQHANQLPPFNLKQNINPYGLAPNVVPASPLTGSVQLSDINSGLPHPVPQNIFYSDRPNVTNTISPAGPEMASPAQLNLPTISAPSGSSTLSSSTTRPMEPNMTSPAPPNPLSRTGSAPQTPHIPAIDRDSLFSNILDFSAISVDHLSVSGDSSAPDEHIDFDALWAWPNNTSALGTPRAGTVNPSNDSNGVQGISDSMVPLFGVVEK